MSAGAAADSGATLMARAWLEMMASRVGHQESRTGQGGYAWLAGQEKEETWDVGKKLGRDGPYLALCALPIRTRRVDDYEPARFASIPIC